MLDEYFPQSSGDDVQSYPFRLGSDLPHEDPRSVLQLEAFTEDGDYIFEHSESGERLTVFHVKHTRGKTPKLSRGGPLYIPIHSMCLQLASRLTNSACTSKKSHGGSINSIKSLWEVLYRRLRGLSHPVPSTWMIQEPHDYFGGTGCRNLEWEANNDPEFGQVCIGKGMLNIRADAATATRGKSGRDTKSYCVNPAKSPTFASFISTSRGVLRRDAQIDSI